MTKQESDTDTTIFVPEILFQTEHINITNNPCFETSELIRKDQALIHLLKPEKPESQPPVALHDPQR